MKEPSHPGALVRDSIDELELTITDADTMLGVSRLTLNNLVNENSALSAEMAIRLEKMGWSKANFGCGYSLRSTWHRSVHTKMKLLYSAQRINKPCEYHLGSFIALKAIKINSY